MALRRSTRERTDAAEPAFKVQKGKCGTYKSGFFALSTNKGQISAQFYFTGKYKKEIYA